MKRKWPELLKSASNDLRRQSDLWQIELYLAIIRVADSLDAMVYKQFSNHGINRANLGLLYHLIANQGVMTQKELAKATSKTKQAVGLSLGNLEKRGLVSRRRLKSDQRVKMVTITRKGLKLAMEILPLREELLVNVISCIGKMDARKMNCKLYKLREKVLSEMYDS
jgi:DNA-binding MarR family transcriptional regulator